MAKAGKKAPKVNKASRGYAMGGMPMQMRSGMAGPVKSSVKGNKRGPKPGAVC